MRGVTSPASPATPLPVEHYENFPVASWLCPPRFRPPIAAIYHFARTADDIADEGDAPAAERLAELAAYRADLAAAAAGRAPGPRWPQVFGPLADAIQRFALPVPLLADLLDAFEQDVHRTAAGQGYADWIDLLGYCRRSANPVGRLLLHLYGITDAVSLDQSDRICTGLQVTNFLQDLGTDVQRGRFYATQDRLDFHAITHDDLRARVTTPAIAALVLENVMWCRATLKAGAPLATRIPGRAGWELRLVVQGGLRVLEKIDALHHDTLAQRPVVTRADGPRLLWRALRM